MLSLSLFLDPLEDGQFPTIAQEAILHGRKDKFTYDSHVSNEQF